MKPIHQLPIILFLLSSICLHGQIQHELKIDISNAFSKEYIPYYEAVLSKRFAIEAALGFDFSEYTLVDIQTSERFQFSARQFNPSIGGKYFCLFNKKYGGGLFVGPYVQLNYLLNREAGYAQKWEEIWNRPAPEWFQEDKGPKRLFYGIQGGYKWLIKNHILIGLQLTWSIDRILGKGSSAFNDSIVYRGDGYIKIGYRF